MIRLDVQQRCALWVSRNNLSDELDQGCALKIKFTALRNNASTMKSTRVKEYFTV